MGLLMSRAWDGVEDGVEGFLHWAFGCGGGDGDGAEKPAAPADGSILRALRSGKIVVEGSLSFKRTRADSPAIELETSISIRSGGSSGESESAASPESEFAEHHAAVKLQKVYKSFRTRRQLADCAVLVEQHWWKLLDFALLKRSSVSFFDIEKQETAVSRWSRARTRAAKVGKGLAKDEKAQKLALQHWLEAIDPRHRYGHNLHFYYDHWLHSESKEPFFYWLDVGEGKEVTLEDHCSRTKLQLQCIKYLGPKERELYEVIVQEGKLLYKVTGQLLDTSEGADKWIFVLSTTRNLYVGQKKKGTFQHSSFLAGGATSAAGRIIVAKGYLKAVWPHSGHYRPTEENFQEFKNFLQENNVNLSDVKMSPEEEDEPSIRNPSQPHHKPSNSFCIDLAMDNETVVLELPQKLISHNTECTNACEENSNKPHCDEEASMLSSSHCKETTEEAASPNEMQLMSDDQEEGCCQAPVRREVILKRINSKKETNSYQLGKQLSFKWTTGAGPRIGCVRDYPSELQYQALEQVSLSPRSETPSKSRNFSTLASKTADTASTTTMTGVSNTMPDLGC